MGNKDDVDMDCEKVVRQSWRSFSTMSRFLTEGPRLENASWRLWHMKKQTCNASSTKGLLETSENNEVDATIHVLICVYCEKDTAVLRCDGCCHDPYCAECFTIIHKKGNLATHVGRPILNKEKSVNNSTSNRYIKKKKVTSRDPKDWEVHMAELIQTLMHNSLHNEGDISVRNAGLHVAPNFIKPTLNAKSTVNSSRKDISQEKKERTNSLSKPIPIPSLKSKQSSSRAGKCSNCGSTEHILITCPSLGIDEHNDKNTVFLDPPSEFSSPSHPLLSTSTPSLPSGIASIVCRHCGKQKVQCSCYSRLRRISCANCNGEHMTIDCGKLKIPLTSSSKFMAPVNPSVGTMIRKCFTAFHNDNRTNSTHAYLGDEMSVRAGMVSKYESFPLFYENIGLGLKTNSSEKFQEFYRNDSIIEDCKHCRSMQEEGEFNCLCPHIKLEPNPLPIYPSLLNQRESQISRKDWILPSLFSVIPEDILKDVLLDMDKEGSIQCRGWVMLRRVDNESDWFWRYLVVRRNILLEYTVSDFSIRPIGCSNLSNAVVFDNELDIHLSIYPFVTIQEKSNYIIRFGTKKLAKEWTTKLSKSIELGLEDIYNLAPKGVEDKIDPKSLELGVGRFSVVRRAESITNGKKRDCALKIIDKGSFWNLVEQGLERDDTLYREIWTQSLLTARSSSSWCPVVRLRSIFETRTMLVLEMELMHGGDLFDALSESEIVSEKNAAVLVKGIIKAVAFCLCHDVVHRDIKLSNIAITQKAITIKNQDEDDVLEHFKEVKLADFGMAAFANSKGLLRGRCGTPGYVAPEILKAGKHESYMSCVDMFSVGVVLYTLLCGYEPFYGVNDKELVAVNKTAKFVFQDSEWSSISSEAKDLITKLMNEDPKQRITPNEALKHPWIVEHTCLTDIDNNHVIDMAPFTLF